MAQIPAAATITGIALTIHRAGAFNLWHVDQTVRLLNAGAMVGDNKASAAEWPSTLTDVTYGGPGDLWKTTWSVAEVNATGFGAAYVATYAGSAGNGAFSVDSMRITVFYSCP